MIGALWTGISGLSSQQQALDNESNNIANVNTVGFKSSRISFADQMYQDRIGKGSKILDAEKLYTQGNLKLTGVSYDMALSGEGFFSVANNRTSGTSEILYTRAGNFRMGDNGTLQDAAGNEVQGWMMSPIDTENDVVTTNPNAHVFTNDYNKLLNSKVIRHSTYVETITAKATDYTATAKSDSATVFTGAGMKTASAKISDIEAAITDYSNWLQKLKDSPDGASATSIAQVSQVNFKSGNDGLVTKDGDQIYVYIDGNKISQNYVPTTATDEFKTSMLKDADTTAKLSASTSTITIDTVANNSRYQLDIDGTTVYYDSDQSATEEEIVAGLAAAITSAGISGVSAAANITNTNEIDLTGVTSVGNITSFESEVEENYDIAASRIETYKALADKISEIAGLKAYMVSESDADGVEANDVLQLDEQFAMSTYNKDMYKGMIQIKSLIPGQEFIVSEVAEVSGSSAIQGNFQTHVTAQAGQGIGALETSRDALARLVTGKQQDVYTPTDLGLAADGTSTNDYTYGITIYDNELGATIPVPNDGGTPPEPLTILIDAAASIDDIVNAINNPSLSTFTSNNQTPSIVTNSLPDYVVAKNVNGNLVIETLDKNYDVEFTGSLKLSNGTVDSYTANNPTSGTALTGSYTPIDKNNNYSGREGAGAEFIEIVNKVDQTASKGSLQLRLDTLGISDSAFGEFSVDSTGLITMKQDGAEFAIGQVAIALFNNNRGLEPVGDNLLSKTTESGEPIYNLNNDKTAKVEAQTLELSTADLSESLVNLMVFQRAFEANAKSITTSDELLNTLINLKR